MLGAWRDSRRGQRSRGWGGGLDATEVLKVVKEVSDVFAGIEVRLESMGEGREGRFGTRE